MKKERYSYFVLGLTTLEDGKVNNKYADRRHYRVKKNIKVLNKICTQHTRFVKDTKESQLIAFMGREITFVLRH
jgi:hypothetical protein